MKDFDIIPAIDILNKKVVRLKQGRYDKVNTYKENPVELALKLEQLGAKKIHLVDLNGAKSGKCENIEVFKAIRKAVSCKLELGGGIRSIDVTKELIDIGIDFLVIGSILIKDTFLATTIINKFPNKIIPGLDILNNKIAIEGWLKYSEITLNSILELLNTLPVPYIITTDIKKDGMLEGPNLNLLSSISKLSKTPLIASGGVTSLEDIDKLKKMKNISGCIIGKALLSNKLPMEKLWH